jgi:hypothetical protein
MGFLEPWVLYWFPRRLYDFVDGYMIASVFILVSYSVVLLISSLVVGIVTKDIITNNNNNN